MSGIAKIPNEYHEAMSTPARLKAAYARERRSQLRGLLLLAAAVLALILYRAHALHLFHYGWWLP